MGRARRGYLIDTSVFIAREQGRELGELPDDGDWFVSCVTIGELKAGVLACTDPRVSRRRLETWTTVAREATVLEIDETVANTWGEFVAIAAHEQRRLPIADALIAATAVTDDLVLVTQDHGFSWYPDLDLLLV